MRHSGFLSYSRRDQTVARRLVRGLERWRPSRKLKRATGIDRLHIFRDVEDAELGELSDVLSNALSRSEHLIVLCSPASRTSKYVGSEIETFTEARGPEAIIPVLVDGRPNAEVAHDDPIQDQAFPDALLRYFAEPLAADLRPRPDESGSARRRREREAFFQIVARLLGIAKSDDLVRRDRMVRRLRAGAIASVLLLALLTSWLWWWDAQPRPGLDPFWRLTAMELGERSRDALSRLEAGLTAAIPTRKADDRVLIATWNIRDFPNGPRSITRSDAALTYIAAVLSRFDIVAVQEMRGDAATFDPARQALLTRLGRHWSYIGTGPTDGRLGNGERLGFFFDRRSVAHGGELDEIVLTQESMQAAGLNRQIARTPVVAAFDFNQRRLWLANAHIYFGASSGERREQRTREFDGFARYLQGSLRRLGDPTTRFIILGDFNFDRPDAPEAQIARDQGFFFPPGLLEAGTSTFADRPYDQIILNWDTAAAPPLMTAGGVFRFFDHVYRMEEIDAYAASVRADLKRSDGGELSDAEVLKQFRTRWRTYQLSDHYPKWIELSH